MFIGLQTDLSSLSKNAGFLGKFISNLIFNLVLIRSTVNPFMLLHNDKITNIIVI